MRFRGEIHVSAVDVCTETGGLRVRVLVCAHTIATLNVTTVQLHKVRVSNSIFVYGDFVSVLCHSKFHFILVFVANTHNGPSHTEKEGQQQQQQQQ